MGNKEATLVDPEHLKDRSAPLPLSLCAFL